MWILKYAAAGLLGATLFQAVAGLCIRTFMRARGRRFDSDGIEIL